MALRSGSRSKRAGAHRAPRTPPPAQGTVATPPRDRDSRAGVGVGLRSRAVIVRTSVVVVLAAIVGVGIAYGGPTSAEPTVYKFLLAWQNKQYTQAAKLTTGSTRQVAKDLSSAYRELDATYLSLTMGSIAEHGSTADASFDASIDLGSSGLVWSYQGVFQLRDSGSGWQVVWHPSVITPDMRAGERLAVVSKELARAALEDSAGQPLTVPSQTYEVGVVPGRLTNPALTATEIADITQLPANQVVGQIQAAPSRNFLGLITLAPTETRLRKDLASVPGVVVKPVVKRLFVSIAPEVVGSVGTETAAVLRQNGLPYLPGTTVGLSGLQETYQRQLTGTPRTEVVLQRKGVTVRVLKIWPGSSGKPVRTTLQSSIQLAADRALAGLPGSAAIVAVQPDTGQILAVADHSVQGMPTLNPLAGQYQPGQSFTIVSSAAILAAPAGVSPGSQVSCYQSNPVDGHNFVNDPPVTGLGGSATFQKDFADACSTAFAGLSLDLTPSDLAKAAKKFGVGCRPHPCWQLPVSSYFAGSMGQLAGEPSLAKDTIGDGDVRMSPLGMALAAAVVDSGSWHGPSLVAGDPNAAKLGVMSVAVLTDLRTLMHRAATTGAGRAANVAGDVFGQVGNAAFDGHGMRISWFVGYEGKGVAFAVVELGKSAADSAAPLAGHFLRNIRAGS
jgi:cell division protein FtsI/penicillin-binding protein 2